MTDAAPQDRPVWRLTPGLALAHRGWDEEFVVYDNLSGDTHLLGAAAVAALTVLQHGGADLAKLAAALDLEPDELPELRALLDELAALQLIAADAC